MKFAVVVSFLVLAIICLTIVDAQRPERRAIKKGSGKPSSGGSSINKKPSKKDEIKRKTGQFKRYIITEIPGLGKVKGKRTITAWSHKVLYQYYDVKYGETTSGKNRFKAPRPAEAWQGLRTATAPRHECPSLHDIDLVEEAEIKGSKDYEDCLTLTVSTKSHSSKSPVLVYIHGNYLYDGTPNEASPEYLLEKDVVLVSIRYRLGPFGFLSTLTDHIPGNAGIKDVVLALEWIQKHIDIFGGDPDRVTLFGQVGGAAIINVLTMSPYVSDGLFHKVIYQSGSALTPALTTDDPLEHAKEIGRQAGCPNVQSIPKLNKCFMKMNVTTLLEGFNNQGLNDTENDFGNFGGAQFVVGGPSEILPDYPGKLIQEKKIKYYPTMGGVVKHPGTYVLKDIFEGHFNFSVPDDKYNGVEYIDYIISQTNGEDPTGQWKKFSEKEFFTKQQLKNGSFVKLLPGLIDMCSTIPFKNPVLLTLQANAEKMPENTFLYTFNYEGEFHRYQPGIDDGEDLPFELGVSLTDDNMYLFRWPQYASYLNSRDTRIAKKMVDLWVSFAATGIPKSERIPEWPPMNEGSGPYLKIDRVSSIGQNFLEEYSAAVKDEEKGLTLLSEQYFENLAIAKRHEAQEAQVNNSIKKDENEQNEEDEDEDEDYEEDETKKAKKFVKAVIDNDGVDDDDDHHELLRSSLKIPNEKSNVVIAGRNFGLKLRKK